MFQKSSTLSRDVIDISATAQPPWDRFDPWYQHHQIPVPTLAGMYSATVAGIMEALMLVGEPGKPGHVNLGYLAGGPRCREIPRGHQFKGWFVNGVPVGLGDARRALWIPAYRWVLGNRLAPLLHRLQQTHRERDVLLYDGIDNTDPDAPKALSYADLVVEYCSERQNRLSE